MRHKHEKMRYFHLMKVGDRMLSTKISCLRQHVKIHVLKPNTLKPRLAVIQELWFQFLCINPIFWTVMILLPLNWMTKFRLPEQYRVRTLHRNGQVSPIPLREQSGEMLLGHVTSCAGWSKDTRGCKEVLRAVPTDRIKAILMCNRKLSSLPTQLCCPPLNSLALS